MVGAQNQWYILTLLKINNEIVILLIVQSFPITLRKQAPKLLTLLLSDSNYNNGETSHPGDNKRGYKEHAIGTCES